MSNYLIFDGICLIHFKMSFFLSEIESLGKPVSSAVLLFFRLLGSSFFVIKIQFPALIAASGRSRTAGAGTERKHHKQREYNADIFLKRLFHLCLSLLILFSESAKDMIACPDL